MLGLLGRLAGAVGAPAERERDRAGGDRLDRLRDQPGALADVERLGERGLGARVVAAVAQRGGEPEQRREGDLRAPDLLAELVRAAAGLGGALPVAVAPAQRAADHVREAELAEQALALGEGRARVGRRLDLSQSAR